MPSSYTSSLRLEQMADGENRSTWGQKTDNNLALIDAAIAGVTTIDVTGLTSVTLTAGTATADQSRAAALVIIGIPGSGCTVTWPAATKLVLILNQVTRGTITLAQAGSANTLTLPATAGGYFSFNNGPQPIGGGQLYANAVALAAQAVQGTQAARLDQVTSAITTAVAPFPGQISGLNSSVAANAGAISTEATNRYNNDQLIINSLPSYLSAFSNIGNGYSNIRIPTQGGGSLHVAMGFGIGASNGGTISYGVSFSVVYYLGVTDYSSGGNLVGGWAIDGNSFRPWIHDRAGNAISASINFIAIGTP